MSLPDFIKIPWNKYEAVLLVDAYQRSIAGEMSRSMAISQVSKRLRSHMINMGIQISDVYRNESGISLQMSAIEYLFTDGETGISHVSNLFQDTVKLWQNNKDGFDILLSEANQRYPYDDSSNIGISSNSYPVQDEDTHKNRYISQKLYDLLASKFPRGYKIGSYMEFSRLKKFYCDEYGDEIDMDRKDVDEDVRACGIEYDGRVYLPELMCPDSIKEVLLSFIDGYFENGGSYIFYSVLFQAFKERFLDSRILNDKMLRLYLEYINTRNWHFFEQYFSYEKDVTVNVLQEVIDFVKDQGGVVAEDDVVLGLKHFPEQQVREAFDERDTNLVSCGRNLRFHIDNFVITKDELSTIENIIKESIFCYKFITFSELMKFMDASVPAVIENNSCFTEIGIRNALSQKLGTKFNFYNSVVSDFRHPIKPEDAFIEMAKRPHYTINDVKALAADFRTNPNSYIELMLKYSIRVDKDNFMAKDRVHFDVDAIDDVLLRLCEGDYIALSDVTMLSTLPSCEYQWTHFLLECYVAFYSKVFKLLHNKYFGQANATGGIVKRSSNINDFNTLAATAVVDAGIPIEKRAVLQFLSDKSYIVQRRYEDIDEVIGLANKLTNRIK